MMSEWAKEGPKRKVLTHPYMKIEASRFTLVVRRIRKGTLKRQALTLGFDNMAIHWKQIDKLELFDLFWKKEDCMN